MKPSLAANRLPVACLAPPLTEEKLARYRELAGSLVGEIADAYRQCLACVEAWWELPESTKPATRFTTQTKNHIHVVPLEEEHVAALDEVTPWPRELDTLSNAAGTGLFDGLTGEVRGAAFMLLWYAKEIALDREPVTQDKLK